RWLRRGVMLTGSMLANALHAVTPPYPRQARLWVACESTSARMIRRDVLARDVFDPGAIHTRGYWKIRVANPPNHHMGLDGGTSLASAARPCRQGCDARVPLVARRSWRRPGFTGSARSFTA